MSLIINIFYLIYQNFNTMKVDIFRIENSKGAIELVTKFTPCKILRILGFSSKITVVIYNYKNGKYTNYYTNKKYTRLKNKIKYAHYIYLTNT